jgi:hypothetical protein
MKKIKIYFLTFISAFVLSGIFGWIASSIIVFFVIFIMQMFSDRSNQEKRSGKDLFFYYLGQFTSIALACLASVLLVYLRDNI